MGNTRVKNCFGVLNLLTEILLCIIFDRSRVLLTGVGGSSRVCIFYKVKLPFGTIFSSRATFYFKLLIFS